jgi:hypothetical protein
MFKNSSICAFLVLLLCLLACSNSENIRDNSKTSTSTPKQNQFAPKGYMNVNGVLFSDEENLEMAEKISEEKKRKNLSDKDAVIMGEKMWEEFLNKKRKQQANNNR